MPHRSLAALVLLSFASIAAAQNPPAAPPPQPPAAMTVPRTDAPIQLDGDLSDAAWKQAAVIDRFYETSPGDNTPPKVRTVGYVTYDSRYFYIGIQADDPDPRKIRAPFVDRDGVIGTDDNIAIFLDTRNDKRSAVELRVNPRGIQGDGIFNDANFNEDFAPDFYYDTAARIDEKGWSAEFRIPFTSLRYDSGDPQTWNIMIWRNYPREFRYAFHSAPIPRGSNCHVCHMHPLVGLTGLPAAGHLVAAPYVTAEQVARPRGGLGTPLRSEDTETDAGLDVKWNPTANNAVDLTLNPDFSQVEADVAQITTNRRFAVFFPEKRPFFLEGFDLFDTPMQVLYTRTITDPRWGTRATGKFGNTAYTALVAEDRGGGLTVMPGALRSRFAAQDFKSYTVIGRVRHSLGSSFVGAVVTDREIDGGGHNRVIGPDFQWRPNDSDSVTAQFLYSDTQNPDRRDLSPLWNGASLRSHAFTGTWEHAKRTHDWFVRLRDIGDEFRADLGFIPQVGYREVLGQYARRYYPENSRIRFIRPSIVAFMQTDRDGNSIAEQVSLGVNGFGAKNTQFFVGYLPRERVRVQIPRLPTDPPTAPDRFVNLSQSYFNFFVQTDPHRRLPRISLEGRFGDQINFGNASLGEGVFLAVGATVRPHDRLDLQLNVARETLEARGDRVFTTIIERLRAQYSFSAKSLLRVIAQYVDEESGDGQHGGSFLGSVLYSYKINWQTVLFVGYGDDRVLMPDSQLERQGRSLFFKVSYAYQR